MANQIIVTKPVNPSVTVTATPPNSIQVSGFRGSNGYSAYQVAVSNGFVGTEAQWLASLVGAQGATGLSGGSYTHNQLAVSSTWSVTHNLGYKPAVSAIDSAGGNIYGDISYTSNNTLTITFSTAISGVAYLS